MATRMFGVNGVPDNIEELLMDISRTANTDEDDGGLLVVPRRPLHPHGTPSAPGRSGVGAAGLAAAMEALPPGLVPCMAAFTEPEDPTPPPGAAAGGLAALSAGSLLAVGPTLRALQQAYQYLVAMHTRDVFAMSLIPMRNIFAVRAGRDTLAAEFQAFMETRRRPVAAAAVSSSGGGSYAGFEGGSQPGDSIDLISFLNIQEGVRIEEVRDLRARVCEQLAYIIADAADEALRSAAAAAAAAAVAAVERATGRVRSNNPNGSNSPGSSLRRPGSGGGASGQLPGPQPKFGTAARQALLAPPPVSAGAVATAAAAAHVAASQAAFDPLPFFRITSTLNVALFYNLRTWMLKDLQVYAAAVETYGTRGTDLYLYDGVPQHTPRTAAGSAVSSRTAGVETADTGAVEADALQTAEGEAAGVEQARGQRVSRPSSQQAPAASGTGSISGHGCAPLFHVTLEVVDGHVRFLPPLETISAVSLPGIVVVRSCTSAQDVR